MVAKVMSANSCDKNPILNGAKSTTKVNVLSHIAKSLARKRSIPSYSISSLPEVPSSEAPLFPEE